MQKIELLNNPKSERERKLKLEGMKTNKAETRLSLSFISSTFYGDERENYCFLPVV
jgi:hypothetical protein